MMNPNAKWRSLVKLTEDWLAHNVEDTPTPAQPDLDLPACFFATPFDDKRIERFALSWYHCRESAVQRAQQDAQDLVSKIQDHDGTHKLARIPNLLTMMALIHRIEAELPRGRSKLYDKMSEAYLDTIDKNKRIQDRQAIHRYDLNLKENSNSRWSDRVFRKLFLYETLEDKDKAIALRMILMTNIALDSFTGIST